MIIRHLKSLLIALAVLAAVLVFLPDDVYARAGGGHSSSHSSSSHSSGSSFGGSSSRSYGGSSSSFGGTSGCPLTYLLLGSMMPGWMIFLLIAGFVVVVILKVIRGAAGMGGQGFQLPKDDGASGYVPLGEGGRRQGYSSIKELVAKDPDFSERAFLDKAQTVFYELQKSWMKRDLSPVRPYVTDGVFNRWQVVIDQYKADRQINVVKDPIINNARIVRVILEGDLDAITVEISASMADAMVSEDSPGKAISGSLTEHKPFTEFWTFARKAGVKTKKDARLKMDKCPNCGAPLKISAAGNCDYCGTLVHSPEYDWVLDQITQSQEWV